MFVKFKTQTIQDREDGNRDAHIYKYSWYGNEQYPETREISFSKAGTTPPTNTLFMFDTESKSAVELGNQGFCDADGCAENYRKFSKILQKFVFSLKIYDFSKSFCISLDVTGLMKKI